MKQAHVTNLSNFYKIPRQLRKCIVAMHKNTCIYHYNLGDNTPLQYGIIGYLKPQGIRIVGSAD